MQQEFRQKEATWCWRKRSKIYQISFPVFHVYFILDYDFFVLSSWSLIKQGLTEVASQINQHCCLQGGWIVGRCLPSPQACRALRAEDFLPCFACWVSMLACRALKYKFLFSYKNRCCYYTEKGEFFPLPVNCVNSSNTKYLYSLCQLWWYIFDLLNATLLESAQPIGKTCFAQIVEGRFFHARKQLLCAGTGECWMRYTSGTFHLISCLPNL